MTDSHAHLAVDPIKGSINSILDQFINLGGKHILNVAFDPESVNEVVSQSNKIKGFYPDLLLSSLGVHPEHFSETNHEKSFSRFEKCEKVMDMLEENIRNNLTNIHAIGETGLDYYHIFLDSSIKENEREEIIEIQKKAFRRHAELALELNLPLTIHTRDIQGDDGAVQDALKILADIGKGRLKGSFHSYTGLSKYVSQIVGLGFYVGFNGIITYPSAKNVIENLMLTPDEKILLETDSPLLPVQSVRRDKKRNDRYGKPQDIREILEFVASNKGYTVEKMEEIIDTNFSNLFFGN